ncbi:MAG: hypothetical protein ACXAEU_03855 [Candidatus Hodarchaeales archaeon]|jgi:hypothetical protein
MKEIIDDSHFKIAPQEIQGEISSKKQFKEELVQLPSLNANILRLVLPACDRAIVGFVKILKKIHWDQRQIIDSRRGTYRRELIRTTNSLEEEATTLIEIPLEEFSSVKLKLDIYNDIKNKYIHFNVLINANDKSNQINWAKGGLKQPRRGGKVERVRLLRMLHNHCLEVASIIASFKPNESIKIIQLNKEIGQAIYFLNNNDNYHLRASIRTYKLTRKMTQKNDYPFCPRCLHYVSKKDKSCFNCSKELHEI